MATATPPLSKANTTFALDLFKMVGDKDPTSNVFCSPFNISAALAMVLLGTRSDTATQMAEVLHFQEAEKPQGEAMQIHLLQKIQKLLPLPLKMCLRPVDPSDGVHSSFGELLSQLRKPGAAYALSVANRLYAAQTYQFVEDYLEATRKHYNSELKAVDFATDSEGARCKMNNWVEKNTRGIITHLLAPGVLNSDTKLVLVNAIYFKGNWKKKFQERETHDHKFRINKTETTKVRMMFMNKKFPLAYIGEARCQIIELPYKGKELSMLILLPIDIEDNTTGLEKLEQLLNYDNFVKWNCPDRMDKTEVQLGLPRFKMEETYNLKTVLTSMGMVDVFDVNKSDLSGMSPANDLSLSEFFHKAFVEVNEEGTVAAAANMQRMEEKCAPKPTPIFIADHPFLLFIRHNATSSILFAGRYCRPQ